MRNILCMVVGVVPASRTKNWILRRLGWDVHPTARIGVSIFWRVRSIRVLEGAYIGHFNVFRNIAALVLSDHASVGQFNWISASPAFRVDDQSGSFSLGKHSAVTARHYVDCSGGIRIGNFTTVAGVRSTFITHGINWKLNRQVARGVIIGDHCLVSSNVKVTPGTVVGDHTVIGMGATVSGGLQGHSLYFGGRAEVMKEDLSGAYFTRTEGDVVV